MTRVLVTNVEARVGLAVIRSLGRAGHEVHAASPRDDAIGLYSAFTHTGVVCPAYDSEEFIPWLREYRDNYAIACIIPTEEFLLAIEPHFDEFAPLLPMSRDADKVYAGMSKTDLFETLSRAGGAVAQNLAPFVLSDTDGNRIAGVDAVMAPGAVRFVKVDGRHAQGSQPPGARASQLRAVGADADAQEVVRGYLDDYTRVLVQRYVDGVGVGAFLLRWNGRIVARMMHRRLHELPGSGWSSFRETWWHGAIMQDAEAKLGALDWQGVAMLEYRYNEESDQFALLEMNGRFWGSLHLAFAAGVDFPALLLDAFEATRPASELTEHVPRSRDDRVRCRNTALEIKYVVSRWRDPACDWRERLTAVTDFVRLGLDPRVHSDLWFRGDTGPYWRQWWLYARTVFHRH